MCLTMKIMELYVFDYDLKIMELYVFDYDLDATVQKMTTCP